jgi:hypothetical protein
MKDECCSSACASTATPNNAAYGYSFLIDSDQKFGSSGADADPNALAGNPGLNTKSSSHRATPGVSMSTMSMALQPTTSLPHCRATVRGSMTNARMLAFQIAQVPLPIFIDFQIAFADLGAVVTSNTTLRILFASASSANSALNGSASDIGGVNDDNYVDDDQNL